MNRQENLNKLTWSCVLSARRRPHHSRLSVILMLLIFSCMTASNSPRSFWPYTTKNQCLRYTDRT